MSDISGLSNYVTATKSVTESYKSQKLEVNTKSKSAKADSSLSVKYEQSSYSSAAVYTKSYGTTNAEGYDRYGRKTDGTEGSAEKATALQIKNGTGKSSIPQITNMEGYGKVIGEPKLSEAGQKYYSELKKKFGNMDFVLVSQDMKAAAHANAASYGNPNRMVVLIDDEKLERMATDESYRKKYEGIIAMAQTKMSEAKMGLASSGANVKNFGMSVDSNGKESFFATVNKSSDLQKKRTEKKAAEKKAHKLQEKKKAEKKAQEERIQKARDKKAEKEDTDKDDSRIKDDEEYVTFEADSMDELLSKVQTYSYNNASGKVMTQAEQMVGTKIDFRG